MPNQNSYAWQHPGPLRQFVHTSSSRSHEGLFGRLFRELPAARFDEKHLAALAGVMTAQPAGGPAEQENPDIPAGYTYLGQFITHDLSFDPASLLEQQNDPDLLVDFRTPRFDLDSLYGRGPGEQPYMYASDGSLIPGTGPDLPRVLTNGRAVIPDPRNDENRNISQLHSAFLRFHNFVLNDVGSFDEAQRVVRWHYQWLVLNEYLPRIVPREIIDALLVADEYIVGQRPGPPAPVDARALVRRPNLRFFEPHTDAFMPVEFSAAAFRFGHSMVRRSYNLNDAVRGVPLFSPPGDDAPDLRAFGPLPPGWGIQWGHFFSWRSVPPQASFKIDEHLAKPLGALPSPVVTDGPRSLAERTLQRGVALGLPSGPDVARLLGVEPLKDGDLFENGAFLLLFKGSAPLWYYILREANVYYGGRKLGPVGATIVAEVFIGLLWNDAQSFLRREPRWRPKYGKQRGAPGTYDATTPEATMAGLLYEIGAAM
jgi:hypothetical protein